MSEARCSLKNEILTLKLQKIKSGALKKTFLTVLSCTLPLDLPLRKGIAYFQSSSLARHVILPDGRDALTLGFVIVCSFHVLHLCLYCISFALMMLCHNKTEKLLFF